VLFLKLFEFLKHESHHEDHQNGEYDQARTEKHYQLHKRSTVFNFT